MKFRDIPHFRPPNYRANVSWSYLEEMLASYDEIDPKADLNPDFQRGHVWTPKQKTAYIEFILLGGVSGRDIYWNCPGWMGNFDGPFVLVDGKQRLNAVLEFKAGKVPIFGGHFFDEFEDKLSHEVGFVFHVNDLKSRADLLRWYLALNTGGTIHTPEEIAKVQKLLEIEACKTINKIVKLDKRTKNQTRGYLNAIMGEKGK